ncbi:MAG TPA: hypothetical protein PLZ67_03950 [Bacteroidales bacterium]|nr:hypothetical protein [Bacteroidales bacterium]
MKSIVFVFLLLICVLSSTGQTQKAEYKIFPVDETGKDTSLVAFVAQLKNILTEKDTARLFAIMHPKMVTSFGGAMYGRQDFISKWHLEKSKESVVWDLMLHAINPGGVFCEGIFDEDTIEAAIQYPYATDDRLYQLAAAHFPDMYFDPYFTGVCISKNAPVYENCDESSKQVATLSYDILLIDYEATMNAQPDAGFDFKMHYINTLDGAVKGWIKTSDIYALGGQTLILEKKDGNWMITGFFPFD